MLHKAHELRFARVDDRTSDILATPQGLPVFPVRSQREEDVLLRLSRTLGLRLARTTAHQEVQPKPSDGIVAALGASCQTEAALYAHLTGRRAVTLACVADIASVGPEVVISVGILTDDLYLAAYESSLGGRTVGLICAARVEDLRIRVLLRALALLAPHSPSGTVVRLWATTDLGVHRAGSHVVAGDRADRTSIRELLGSSPCVLQVYGHSDGIDALLPAGMTLCPMAHRDRGPADGRVPKCRVTETCFRLDVPTSSALDDPRAVDVNHVRARLVVLDACWSLHPAFDLYDGRWAYAERLLSRGGVGLVIGSWEALPMAPMDSEELIGAVMAGIPVGQAISMANRRGKRYALHGDPSTTIAPLREAAQPEPLRQPIRFVEAPPAPLDTRELTTDNFLDRYLASSLTNATEDSKASGQHALSRLRASDPDLSVTADYLMDRSTMPARIWRSFVVQEEWSSERRQCLTCERQLVGRRSALRESMRPRHLWFCPRCGLVEDAHVDNQLGLRMTHTGTLHLVGPFPPGPWGGGVVAESAIRHFRQSERWPSAPDGIPLRSWRRSWPPVPSRICVTFIWASGHLVCLASAFRSDDPTGGLGPAGAALQTEDHQ